MMFKSALLILVALTPAMATTTTTTTKAATTTTTTTKAATTTTTAAAATTTTTGAAGTTTTVSGGATTTAAVVTTVAPKPVTTTENVTNTTTKERASAVMDKPASAGDTTIAVAGDASKLGFTTGMEIVIAEEGPNTEFNTVTGFGTLHLATPLVHNHPIGTTVKAKKTDETTTTTAAPNPCIPTTTTTTRGPCDPLVKYNAKTGALAAGNSSGMIGWGFAGFVGVAVAMFALRRNSRQGSYSALTTDLEIAMVDEASVAPQE